jgi:hypothetical protein
MRARQLIGGSTFPPDELKVIFEAFDDAWAELAPEVGNDAGVIEAGRVSLATIVLSLATVDPIDRNGLATAAVEAFRFKHRRAPPASEARDRPLGREP